MLKAYIRYFCHSLLILHLTALSAWSQPQYQITGYVVDSQTGDPVPFASIGVPQQQRGISANINGYFRLLLPDNNPEHDLQITSIGYRSVYVPLSQVNFEQEQTFELDPQPTILEEIVIVGKSQSLENLVKQVSKKRKYFLRSKPYLMNGFYREVLKVDGDYEGLTEAQGILYLNGFDPAYKNNRHHITYDLAQWKHIRRSHYLSGQERYLEISSLLRTKDFFLHEGPLHRRNLDRFNYHIIDSTTYQERLVLEITFEPKEAFLEQIPYKGRMFVKEDDQALLSLEIISQGGESYLKQIEDQQDIVASFKISFFLFDGKYYLNHASLNRSFSKADSDFNLFTELICTSFSNQQGMFLNYNQRVVLYSEMQNPLINYDKSFWDSFSFAQGNDLKSMQEQNPELDRQFESNHEHRLVPLPDGYESYEQMSNDRDALDFLIQR